MGEELTILSKQPEYLHVLLHGFPVYGSVLGALGLAFALICRSRPAQILALSVLLFSGAMALPVDHYGEEAEDRVESLVDEPGRLWVEDHKERAEKVVPLFVALAVCALLAMCIPTGRFPRAAFSLTALTLIVAIGSVAGGAWVSRAGGQIRHKEFRTGGMPQAKKHGEARREKHEKHRS